MPVVVMVAMGEVIMMVTVLAVLPVIQVPRALQRGKNQANVRERLWEVSKREPAARINHFREEAKVIGIGEQF